MHLQRQPDEPFDRLRGRFEHVFSDRPCWLRLVCVDDVRVAIDHERQQWKRQRHRFVQRGGKPERVAAQRGTDGCRPGGKRHAIGVDVQLLSFARLSVSRTGRRPAVVCRDRSDWMCVVGVRAEFLDQHLDRRNRIRDRYGDPERLGQYGHVLAIRDRDDRRA